MLLYHIMLLYNTMLLCNIMLLYNITLQELSIILYEIGDVFEYHS